MAWNIEELWNIKEQRKNISEKEIIDKWKPLITNIMGRYIPLLLDTEHDTKSLKNTLRNERKTQSHLKVSGRNE